MLTTTILTRRRLSALILSELPAYGDYKRFGDAHGIDHRQLRRVLLDPLGRDDLFERVAAARGYVRGRGPDAWKLKQEVAA